MKLTLYGAMQIFPNAYSLFILVFFYVRPIEITAYFN